MAVHGLVYGCFVLWFFLPLVGEAGPLSWLHLLISGKVSPGARILLLLYGLPTVVCGCSHLLPTLGMSPTDRAHFSVGDVSYKH